MAITCDGCCPRHAALCRDASRPEVLFQPGTWRSQTMQTAQREPKSTYALDMFLLVPYSACAKVPKSTRALDMFLLCTAMCSCCVPQNQPAPLTCSCCAPTCCCVLHDMHHSQLGQRPCNGPLVAAVGPLRLQGSSLLTEHASSGRKQLRGTCSTHSATHTHNAQRSATHSSVLLALPHGNIQDGPSQLQPDCCACLPRLALHRQHN
jgi:hypothetical protein